MTTINDVIYGGGILRPLQTLDWQEGKCYTLIIGTKAAVDPPNSWSVVESRTEIAVPIKPHVIHE